jgi:hypothetical protein
VPVPAVARLTQLFHPFSGKSRNENSISALSAKHGKNRLESCGMSWIEGWIIGNELLLAWLVISSPFAVLVGLFIKSGSWK